MKVTNEVEYVYIYRRKLRRKRINVSSLKNIFGGDGSKGSRHLKSALMPPGIEGSMHPLQWKICLLCQLYEFALVVGR